MSRLPPEVSFSGWQSQPYRGATPQKAGMAVWLNLVNSGDGIFLLNRLWIPVLVNVSGYVFYSLNDQKHLIFT
jgi:hypothetical protein